MADSKVDNEGHLKELPREMQIFIKSIVSRHGGGRLSHEEKGLHLYIPCPLCLEEKGARELESKHLTINVDKFFRRGSYRNQKGNSNIWSCYCHRKEAEHSFSVPALQRYKHIKDRGYKPTVEMTVTYQDSKSLIKDDNGNLIPRHPGEVTPIIDLPDDHPAIQYLETRGYVPNKLYDHLRVSYCYKETPEDNGINGAKPWRYPKMPGGWKDTPQGRLIFFVDNFGIQKGWQARILEKDEDGYRWYWHPYKEQWEIIYKLTDDGPILRKDYDGDWMWKASKYRTSPGCHRNMVLMGLDKAKAWNDDRDMSSPLVFVVEGPLDAARIGPPAVAMMGKTLSSSQANLLRSFKHVVLVLDNDDAGSSGLTRAKHVLKQQSLDYSILEVPDGCKDIGEVPSEDIPDLIEPFIDACT